MSCAFPILAYHKVDSRRELGLTSLSPQRFEKQMKFLRNEGYNCISPGCLASNQNFLRLSTDSESISGNFPKAKTEKNECINNTNPSIKPILFTFDDGYEGIYKYVYPLLKEYKYTAIIFVTTGYIGKDNIWDKSPGPRFKHLSWPQIREMADDGIWFGSHGVNHTFLARQKNSKARYEIEVSKKELEDGLGRQIHFFSYPYGNFNEEIVDLIKETGYKAAFSLKPDFLKTNNINGYMKIMDREFTLPRIAIYLLDDMRAFRAKTGNIGKNSLSYIQKAKNQIINRCSYASILADKFC